MFMKKRWSSFRRNPSYQYEMRTNEENLKQCTSPMEVDPFNESETSNFCEKLEAARRRRDAIGSCNCTNCANLPMYTECNVCLNPLQGSKIESCTVCANLVCKSCSVRLTHCAFCRTSKPLERNRAIERLLDKLQLPCKNARNGCKILLIGDNRTAHEKVCNFANEKCPIESSCNWCGPIVSIQSHFRSAHNLSVANDCSLNVVIDQFQQKALAKHGKQYTGCLKCYDQMFFFKVVIYKQKLRIFFCRLGYLCPMTLHDTQQIFKMHLKITSGERKNTSGPYDFVDTNCRNLNAVKIPCSHFYRKCLDIDEKDVVQVNIFVERDYKS